MTGFELDSPDMATNVSWLFQGIHRGISVLHEETYILQALHPEETFLGRFEPYQNSEQDGQYFVSRWGEHRFPLKVALVPDYGYLFPPAELKEMTCRVQHALSQIHEVNPELFCFEWVQSPSKADIVIKLRRGELGLNTHCYPEIGREKQIERAEIQLHVGKTDSPQKHALAVMHNLLHALGVYGHSPFQFDSAYPEWHTQQQILTVRDLNTLKLLYRCPIGMSKHQLEAIWEAYTQYYLMWPENSQLHSLLQTWSQQGQEPQLPAHIIGGTGALSIKELSLKRWLETVIQHIETA